MKHIRLLLALCLLLPLTLTSALAEFDAVPASRIHYDAPDGLKADVTVSDGLLRIAVDTEATNWEKLLATSYDADMNKIILPVRIAAPDGTTAVCTDFYYKKGKVPPQDVFDEIINDAANNNPAESSARWFLEIAHYVSSSEMMQPSTLFTDYTYLILCRFLDDSGNTVCDQQLQVLVTFTSTGMFKADRKKVPAKDIRTGLAQSLNSSSPEPLPGDVMIVTVQDGSVLCELPDVGAVSPSLYRPNMFTYVAVPQALLSSGKPAESWWCRNAHTGNTNDIDIMGDASTGYYIELPIPFPQENGQVENQSYALSWGYADTTVDTGALSIRIVTGDPQPWPAYVDGWKTVPRAHMDLSKYDALQSSMDITYDRDTGILHFGVQEGTLPAIEDIENINWKPVVRIPEEGAAAYSCWRISTSELYGSQFTAEWQAEMEAQLSKTANRRVIPAGTEAVTLNGSSLFTAYHPSSDGVESAEAQETLAQQTVFLPADMTGENAGAAQVIYWYASETDADPFLIEYMIDTREEFVLTQESKAQVTLGESVTIPVFLIDAAHEKTDCYLIINTYPQADGHYIYYELQLVNRDDDGTETPVTLDPGLTYRLFIPYPEGYGKNSEDVTFIIRHLNSRHEVAEIFDEEGHGGIERTEDGLIITIKSLSPFELVWYTPEAAANPSALPETGDPSRILLWLALACVSVAALAACKKRMKNA